MNNILSRKLILSAMLAVIATTLVWFRLIADTQWQWVIMATVVSYVVSMTAQPGHTKLREESKLKAWGNRIKNLFSRSFVISIITILVSTALLCRKSISSTVWFAVVSTIAGAYNILNAIGKQVDEPQVSVL